MSALGVDVSKYQGSSFPFVQAKDEGREFAIIQVGYGTSTGISIDPMFASNLKAARAAGLAVGFYFFAYPSASKPGVQAKAFWETIAPYYKRTSDILPALDFEEPPFEWDWALGFLEYVSSRAGGAIFYSYLAALKGPPKAFAKYPLWLADYTSTRPAAPAPWTRISIWQKADRNGVDGLSVDLDIAEVPLSSLKAAWHWHYLIEAGGRVVGNVRQGGGRVRKLLNPLHLAQLAAKYGHIRILRRRGK